MPESYKSVQEAQQVRLRPKVKSHNKTFPGQTQIMDLNTYKTEIPMPLDGLN